MKRLVAIKAALVPPNADRGARFEPEFFQNVLHVFLHGARAAAEDFSNLGVAFAGRDPLGDFKLALGQGARLGNSASSGAEFLGNPPFREGMADCFLAERVRLRP